MNNLDIVFVIPGNAKKIYQSLSVKYSAIEPPTWALLLAQSCRSKNFSVKIIDANAENLENSEVLNRLKQYNPKLLCFVVYGQNVNAGTISMSGAVELSKYIKKNNTKFKIVYVGSHLQALPFETLDNEQSIDIILTNEGVYSLHNLLTLDVYSEKSLENIKGICFRKDGKSYLTLPEKVVPQEKMDIDLPGYAWDLLPYNKKPLDLYRSPMWHAEYNDEFRSPYAALQTSLGCRFGCNFCMINLIKNTIGFKLNMKV